MSEPSNSFVEALQGLVQAKLLDVNTALPGVIVSYENGYARVSVAVQKRYADGDVLDYPIIPRSRVCWPSFAGGSAGVKGPVRTGDKCLIIISQQAIDGGDDRRAFDLSDAYVVMCDLGNTGSGDSGNNADMTMYFGPASIQLTEGGALKINAPGGVTITTPTTTTTGALTTQGLLTYQAGLAGSGGSGAIMTGSFTQTGGPLSSNGKVLDSHTHGGVTAGGSSTSSPN